MPLRVLITTSHALPHIGGIAVLVDTEVRALAAAGHEVTVVTSRIGGKGDAPVYPPNVRVLRVWASPILERIGLFFPLFSPWLLWVLWREVGRAEVVHGHAWVAPNTALALLFARLRGVRAILTEHNGIQPRKSRLATWGFRLLVETIGRVSVGSAGRCVTYNARVMADLRRIGGSRKPVEFIPYSINADLFRPPTPDERTTAREALGWAPGRKKVLFVGRLVAEKGIPLLLGAVDPEQYDIVFCGSGDPAILGPLPRPGVEYLPPRKQAELVRVYYAADVMVLPSFVEGFPLVAREAMACGLPTILGYDPGYEPYRGMPLLRFCGLTEAEVSSAIRERLETALVSNRPPASGRLMPLNAEWMETVYRFGDRVDPVPADSLSWREVSLPGLVGTNRPRVSVVMVVLFPDPRYFPEALESLLRQTVADLEVILLEVPSARAVADDLRNCNDNRVRLFRASGPATISEAVNFGLTVAKGELIARFDADDIAEPVWLETAIRHLDANPQLGLVGSFAHEMTADGRVTRLLPRPVTHGEIVRFMRNWSPIYQNTLVCWKRHLEAVGGYQFGSLCEDYELFARLAAAGVRMENLPIPLVRYRRHAGSISISRLQEGYRAHLAVKDRYFRRQFTPGDWLTYSFQLVLVTVPPAVAGYLLESCAAVYRSIRMIRQYVTRQNQPEGRQ